MLEECKDKGVRSEREIWRILCYESVAALTERAAGLIEFQLAAVWVPKLGFILALAQWLI